MNRFRIRLDAYLSSGRVIQSREALMEEWELIEYEAKVKHMSANAISSTELEDTDGNKVFVPPGKLEFCVVVRLETVPDKQVLPFVQEKSWDKPDAMPGTTDHTLVSDAEETQPIKISDLGGVVGKMKFPNLRTPQPVQKVTAWPGSGVGETQTMVVELGREQAERNEKGENGSAPPKPGPKPRAASPRKRASRPRRRPNGASGAPGTDDGS